MNELTLVLTVDEANRILEGLGRMPFVKVYALIAKIQKQAKAQAHSRDQDVSPAATALPNAAGEDRHAP